MSGVQKVAIDLRRNPGGTSTVTDAVLQYLPADALRGHTTEVRFSAQANAQYGYSGPGDPRAYRATTVEDVRQRKDPQWEWVRG